MPPALADNVTDEPRDWAEWQMTVKATIEHYSGTKGKNIPGVYYEVWNEPDLFGVGKSGARKTTANFIGKQRSRPISQKMFNHLN